MGEHGYIYVVNWERRQHHQYEHPPWHKVYNALLRDDDYLGLSHADRGLLHDLWSLASLSGDGRVSADRTLLARQLNVRRVSLEPLIKAGFIKVLRTKRVRKRTEPVPQSREEKNPPIPPKGGTEKRERPRERRAREEAEWKRAKAVQTCRRLYEAALDDGEQPAVIRDSLECEYNHDKAIVFEAIASSEAKAKIQ